MISVCIRFVLLFIAFFNATGLACAYDISTTTNQTAKDTSLVIIDAAVPNKALLKKELAGFTTVYELDTQNDFLSQVANIALQHSNISSLHIISHGRPGELLLNGQWHNQQNLASDSLLWQQLNNSFLAGADLLLYGCNVAEGKMGKQFISELASISGFNVAASNDISGFSKLGGDWELEINVGRIKTKNIINQNLRNQYRAILAAGNFIVGDGNGGGGGGGGQGTVGQGGNGGAGGSGADSIIGTAGDDVILGDGSGGGGGSMGDGATVDGTGGAGGSGADTINGGNGNDIIFGDGFDGKNPVAGAGGAGGFGGGGGGGVGGAILTTPAGGVGGLGAGSGGGSYDANSTSPSPLVAGFGNAGSVGPGGAGGDSATDSDTHTGSGANGGGGGANGGGGGGGAFGGAAGGAGANPSSAGSTGSAGDTALHQYVDTGSSIYSYVSSNLTSVLSSFSGYGNGADILDGEAGSDHLFGLGGNDMFVFEFNDATSGNDADIIYDFNANGETDKIRLTVGGTVIDANSVAAIIGAQTTSGNDRSIVFGEIGGNKVSITVKNIGRDLTASDFETGASVFNVVPTISVGNLSYTENDAATSVTFGATVTDSDDNWSNGTFTVQISANSESTDEISIDTSGNFSIAAGTLSHSATAIGSISESSGTANDGTVTNNDALTITFNANATSAILQNLIRSILYRSTSEFPSETARSVTFSINDNRYASASDVSTISVTAVNDLPTGSVSIAGSATQNQTLTASNTLADIDGLGTISYQWKRDGTAISGATNNTYVLTQTDVGTAITVTASYTDGAGAAESKTSSATAAVANVNDNPTGSVSISGTATQNQTLTASNTLADIDGLGAISYQWKRNGSAIGGATSSTYALTQTDVGTMITVTASYTDGFGTAENKTSAATAAVANVNDSPTGSVSISGTATQNQTLTASNTLADVDGLGAISYQWKRDGNAISGATTSSYTLVQADVGKTITVTASYTDGQGAAESKTSSATSVVANVNDSPTGNVTISGTASQNETLNVSNTLADLDGLGVISYQWKRDGVAITGETGTSYVLTQSDVGAVISATASYTDDFGAAESKTSSSTAAIANVNDDPTGSVTISGTATEYETLSVSNTLADIDGLGAISYQWKRDGVAITGETSTSYALSQVDVGKLISVTASYTDDQGTAESETSAPTVAIANVNDAPTGSVIISGVATQHQILSASNTLADNDGLGTIGYQWNRDGTAISGANSSSYTLVQADVGSAISVTASYTDGQGTLESSTSSNTTAILNVNDLPTGSVIISGSIEQNQVLTVSNTLADEDGLGTVAYQWLRAGEVISGATATSYTLEQIDVGKVISVIASFTDDFGVDESKSSGATSVVANVNDAPVAGFYKAVDFDGIDDVIQVEDDNSLDVSNALTIEVWAKPIASNTSSTIVSKWSSSDDTSNENSFLLYLDATNTIQFLLSNNGSNDASSLTLSSTSAIPMNEWTHIAVSYDGANVTLYINGSEDTSASYTSNIYAGSYPLGIGATISSGVENYFAGQLDELRLWNLARTATEVDESQLKPLRGNESGLVAYWNFNDLNTTYLTDLSGNENLATLMNFALSGNSSNLLDSNIIPSGELDEDSSGIALFTTGGSDIDNDGSNQVDSLVSTVASLPANGKLFQTTDGVTSNGVQIGSAGTVITHPLGKLVYKPNNNFYGSDSFSFRVFDGALYSTNSPTVSLSVNNINDDPVVFHTPVTEITEGTTYSSKFNAVDDDPDDILVFSAPVLPAWLSFDTETGVLNGIPQSSDIGMHDVTLRVNDGSVDIEQSFTITVVAAESGSTSTVNTDTSGDTGSTDSTTDSGDTTPDVPVDSDNDGIPDSEESLTTDTDGDGVPDYLESNTIDTDNDGTPDYFDTDSDNDGIPDGEENTLDSDGDGIPDSLESNTADTDNDGIPNYLDTDSDNDGIPDGDEGLADSDGDGILDMFESSIIDVDGDGLANSLDSDSDADNVSDGIEGNLDSDGDGLADLFESNLIDSDNDGIADYQDNDSDGDGINDELEASLDTDGDSIPDSLESNTNDADNDGLYDFEDDDSDGDGIPDTIERSLDTDGDGIKDYLDLDSDNDGISDSEEGFIDSDKDGTPDYRDLDSDNDGKFDSEEGLANSDGDSYPDRVESSLIDKDNDGIPDEQDDDSDADLVLDGTLTHVVTDSTSNATTQATSNVAGTTVSADLSGNAAVITAVDSVNSSREEVSITVEAYADASARHYLQVTQNNTTYTTTASFDPPGTSTLIDKNLEIISSLTVNNLDLVVTALPDGDAIHQLSGASNAGNFTTRATFEIPGVNTVVNSDGQINSSLDRSNSSLAASYIITAETNGQAKHEVTTYVDEGTGPVAADTTKASSHIQGVKTIIDSTGTVTTTASNSKNAKTVNAIVATQANGESQTWFAVTTESETTVERTVNEKTPFESGNQIILTEKTGKHIISIDADLTKELRF